jgi:DNA-binding NarL/FixJ family response regulator
MLSRNEREEEVVKLFTAGYTHEQIAEKLSTASRPLVAFMLKSHLNNAARKKGLSLQALESELKK